MTGTVTSVTFVNFLIPPKETITAITINTAKEIGFGILGLDFSPIKGPEGNIEYLIYLQKSDEPQSFTSVSAEEIVNASHEKLDK